MEYFILTEANLPRFLWRVLTHRKTCVIATRSQFFGAKVGHLNWVVARFQDRVKTLEEDHLEWLTYPYWGDFVRGTNTFAEMEPWLERRLEFDRSDELFGEYGLAYRHACSEVAYRRYELGYKINDVLTHTDRSAVIGIDDFDDAFRQERFGDLSTRLHKRIFFSNLINITLTLVTLAYSLGWVAWRTRLILPAPKSFRLGSDFHFNSRNSSTLSLWDEVSTGPQDVLVVHRSKSLQKAYADSDLQGRPCVAVTDGLFSLKGGVIAMSELVADSLKILRHGHHHPTAFFYQVIVHPFKRMVFRGLFNRYHFDYFWAKDDYNSEHVMRSIELRRANGISLGWMHGIPSTAIIVHQTRYIDFDIYYIHGRYLYESYWREKWPKDMQVRVVGSLGLPREDLRRLADASKGNDVACFVSPSFQADETFAAIQEIARAFPKRTFYVNFKPKEINVPGEYGPKLKNFLDNLPDNVVRHVGHSYDLFFSCRTVLSEGSTLGAEAVQFGLESYIFDFAPDRWKALPYRDFPDICVHSAAETIDRMRSVEAGTWAYPRQAFEPLIDMSGRIPWDVIREDMGLPSKDGGAYNEPE